MPFDSALRVHTHHRLDSGATIRLLDCGYLLHYCISNDTYNQAWPHAPSYEFFELYTSRFDQSDFSICYNYDLNLHAHTFTCFQNSLSKCFSWECYMVRSLETLPCTMCTTACYRNRRTTCRTWKLCIHPTWRCIIID